MHIIIIGTAYPFRGGLAAFNERLAREYQLQGHKVEIMTFTLQYPGFLFPGKTQFSSEPRPEDSSALLTSASCFRPVTATLVQA